MIQTTNLNCQPTWMAVLRSPKSQAQLTTRVQQIWTKKMMKMKSSSNSKLSLIKNMRKRNQTVKLIRGIVSSQVKPTKAKMKAKAKAKMEKNLIRNKVMIKLQMRRQPNRKNLKRM